MLNYVFLIVLIIFLDQITKYLATKYLRSKKRYFLNRKIQLTYVRNYGAAFNILEKRRKLLLMLNIVGVMFLIGLLWYYIYSEEVQGLAIGIALVLGGGLGNIVDRIRKGYVVDFIYFNIKKWPVFNIADFFVFGGALILVIANLLI